MFQFNNNNNNNNIVNIFSVPAKEVYKLAALIFDTQKSGKRLIKLMQILIFTPPYSLTKIIKKCYNSANWLSVLKWHVQFWNNMYIAILMLKSGLQIGNKFREFCYSYDYCKWWIKHHSSYFIFPVISPVLIQEQHLFQLQVKH